MLLTGIIFIHVYYYSFIIFIVHQNLYQYHRILLVINKNEAVFFRSLYLFIYGFFLSQIFILNEICFLLKIYDICFDLLHTLHVNGQYVFKAPTLHMEGEHLTRGSSLQLDNCVWLGVTVVVGAAVVVLTESDHNNIMLSWFMTISLIVSL